MGKFSILMANYNGGKYIAESIQSALNQTYEDWELIIVDDKSTDNSLKVIQKFLNDGRIKLIKRDENGGYGKTLQTAMEHVSGSICGILDSDDVLDVNAIKIMVDAHIGKPNCGLIYSQYMKCNQKLKPTREGDCGPLQQGKSWLDHILQGLRPKVRLGHFKTFKKEAYDKTEGFHEYRRTVDKDIVLKLEEVTDTLFINKILYYYRIHPQCISRNKKTRTFGKIVINNAKKRRGYSLAKLKV